MIAVVLACGAAGGAVAYFAFLKPDSTANSSDDLSRRPPSPTAGAATGQADAGKAREDPRTDDTDAGASPDTPTGDRSTSDDTSGRSPEEVLRSHYELVDQGDYEAAWKIFHPDYRNGVGARWVLSKNKGRPRLDIDSIKINPAGQLGPRMVRLDVELVAADTAGKDARSCRRFVGWTRMQRVSGKWLYRPGEVDGRKPGLEAKPISDSDPRCRRVLQ